MLALIDKYKSVIDIVLTCAVVFFAGISWYFNRKASQISVRPLITMNHIIEIDEDKSENEDFIIRNIGNGPALNIEIRVFDNGEYRRLDSKFSLMSKEEKRDVFKASYDRRKSIFDNKYQISYNDFYNNNYVTFYFVGNNIVKKYNNLLKRWSIKQ